MDTGPRNDDVVTESIKTQVAAAHATVTAALALIKHFGVPAAAHAVWIETRFGEDGTGRDTIVVAVRPGSKWEPKVYRKLEPVIQSGRWRQVPVAIKPWPAGDG